MTLKLKLKNHTIIDLPIEERSDIFVIMAHAIWKAGGEDVAEKFTCSEKIFKMMEDQATRDRNVLFGSTGKNTFRSLPIKVET